MNLLDVMQYFDDDATVFSAALEQLDDLTGILGNDRCYDMDKVDDWFPGYALSALQCAYKGHDEESWEAVGDLTRFCKFNPGRKFFYFDGKGGMISTDHKNYADYLTADTLSLMWQYRERLAAITGDEYLRAQFM